MATEGWRLHHSMIRIKDAKASQKFYQDVMGMTLLYETHFEEAKFSLYFYGYVPKDTVIPPKDKKEDTMSFLFGLKATHVVELTHNWGTEDPATNFAGYHNGNNEPKGFGHLAIVVPDVYAAVERFRDAGAKILKEVDGGRMKGIAFVADPDGYWIEVIPDAWDGNPPVRK